MRSLQKGCGLGVLLFFSVVSYAQSLATSQAKAHEGERATVCAKVAGERTATASRGEPTFIDLDAGYPNRVFTILIWGEDRTATKGRRMALC
jgi:hypothetical protein